ncbi:transposase [Streptomyces sp. NPDC057245]|uniref:transposase n=1 Tax=Streptomyces sp. NPDC057245 TaxID=3346065 RepID=UPI00362EC9CB
MLLCDGLSGLPDAVNTVWPATTIRTCVGHLLRNNFRASDTRPGRTGRRSRKRSDPSTPRR